VSFAPEHADDGAGQPLTMSVGCTFSVETVRRATATLQVAPTIAPGISILSERWSTPAYHHPYLDQHHNRCERFELVAGATSIDYSAEVALLFPADVIAPDAHETPVSALPDDVLAYVMPSRFCLPDVLGNEAWQRFGSLAPGWSRVQAVVDYVHSYITYTPGASNPWTTAADVNQSGQGVCRDYAHLAITFCRALNIPARYVFGYIPDTDVPGPVEPMDFAAWFEAYLDGHWYTFDARNNRPLVGRVVVGRGRDAIDNALITSFGPLDLTYFEVRAGVSTEPT
jgi:transglutaminase-like putative cysteine protease